MPINNNIFKTMETTTLLSIAEEYGSPVYVYDAQKIISQYERLTSAFKKVKHLRINYAVKALSNISVLKLFKQLGGGLDTVSIQEVQLGLLAGFSQNKSFIHLTEFHLRRLKKWHN